MIKRLGIISLFIILFIAFITIWNFSYQKGKEDAYIPLHKNQSVVPIIPLEKGVFKRFDQTVDYSKMPVDVNHQRSLNTYYNNRAFYGAPPTIPHKVENERTMGNKTCLKCHQNGGFVNKFNAYAPITPHPEMVNCRQCHVPQKNKSVFVANKFKKGSIPSVGNNNALLDSPPAIPHQLHMRENCLSCHAGPSAPKEIRVSHPERINCRQCHLPNHKITENIGFFTRKSKIDE